MGTSPRPAADRARAASTSSSARNQATSETAAAAPPRAKVPSKRLVTGRSYREEHGLALALQPEVEAGAVVGRSGEQGPPGGVVGQRPQDDVLVVGLGLVGEVDAGDHAVEQSAREHRDVDVRRLKTSLAVGHPAGLEGEDAELTGTRLRAGVP